MRLSWLKAWCLALLALSMGSVGAERGLSIADAKSALGVIERSDDYPGVTCRVVESPMRDDTILRGFPYLPDPVIEEMGGRANPGDTGRHGFSATLANALTNHGSLPDSCRLCGHRHPVSANSPDKFPPKYPWFNLQITL